MATGIAADLEDAVARAVTTALRDSGYVVDSDDEADSARLVYSWLAYMNLERVGTRLDLVHVYLYPTMLS